jgi:hypothetical protein
LTIRQCRSCESPSLTVSAVGQCFAIQKITFMPSLRRLVGHSKLRRSGVQDEDTCFSLGIQNQCKVSYLAAEFEGPDHTQEPFACDDIINDHQGAVCHLILQASDHEVSRMRASGSYRDLLALYTFFAIETANGLFAFRLKPNDSAHYVRGRVDCAITFPKKCAHAHGGKALKRLTVAHFYMDVRYHNKLCLRRRIPSSRPHPLTSVVVERKKVISKHLFPL